MFHVSKVQGAKKVSFTACLLGKQWLARTGLEFFLMSGIDYSSSVIWTPQKTSHACLASWEQNSLAQANSKIH